MATSGPESTEKKARTADTAPRSVSKPGADPGSRDHVDWPELEAIVRKVGDDIAARFDLDPDLQYMDRLRDICFAKIRTLDAHNESLESWVAAIGKKIALELLRNPHGPSVGDQDAGQGAPPVYQLSLSPLDKAEFHCVLLGGDDAPDPEKVAAFLRIERCAVVCIDARRVRAVDVISEWLRRFDACLSDTNTPESVTIDGPQAAMDVPRDVGLYEPRRVVLANPGVAAEFHEDTLMFGDVTCLPTEPNGEDAYVLYTRFVDETLRRAFTPPERPRRSLPKNLRSIESTLSEGERQEWRAKMDQLTNGGGDEPNIMP